MGEEGAGKNVLIRGGGGGGEGEGGDEACFAPILKAILLLFPSASGGGGGMDGWMDGSGRNNNSPIWEARRTVGMKYYR